MIDFHVVDAGAARTLADAPLESLDCFRVAFRSDLDAAVGKVTHPAVHAFAHRRRFDEETEADALDASADQVSTREAHVRNNKPSVRLYCSDSVRLAALPALLGLRLLLQLQRLRLDRRELLLLQHLV